MATKALTKIQSMGQKLHSAPSNSSSSSKTLTVQRVAGLPAERTAFIAGENRGKLALLDFPVEILEHIFSYLSYDQIAQSRPVCHVFNEVCSQALNRGFIKVEKYHAVCLKKVKAQLPRRESERRNHPLARHCDVLSAIETRLSLLGMTFMKYVEMQLCCFVPGKVIDEIYRVLRVIECNSNPPKVHELLQELRDISSMSMEYFEERIAPTLKNKLTSPTNNMIAAVAVAAVHNSFRGLPVTQTNSPPALLSTPNSVNRAGDFMKLHQTLKQMKIYLRKKIKDCEAKIKEQEKQIKEQNQLIHEQNTRIAEQDGRIHELHQKHYECDLKIGQTTSKIISGSESTRKMSDRKAKSIESLRVVTRSMSRKRLSEEIQSPKTLKRSKLLKKK